jgi:hypothetical protein
MLRYLFFYLFLVATTRGWSQSQTAAAGPEIDFVSDTQLPMAVEKIKLRANHNGEATSLIFSDIVRSRPQAVYMLGDVTAASSSNHRWGRVDRFLDSCRKNGIIVHGLLGNHDVMWTRRRAEREFQLRFPDHVDTGYISITDSMALIMLNSNFKKLTGQEIAAELHWYRTSLHRLDKDSAIVAIIVCCHHAPYSNSLIVGSSTFVRQNFVPAYQQSVKGRLFITGHAHAFEHFIVAGKDFLVIGGGGGLHQPLDTSAKHLPDIAAAYKPMFHYLSMHRSGEALILNSHFEKPDFSGFSDGYSFAIKLR